MNARRVMALAGVVTVLAIAAGIATAATFTCTTSPCIGTEEADNISGTSADEIIRALAGKDQVSDESGNDDIYAGRGNDSVNADTGLERDFDGNDDVYAGRGDDYLLGAGGNDLLVGDEGNDQLEARDDAYAGEPGVGQDVVKGGPGRDDVQALDGQFDSINCGGGTHDSASADPGDVVKNCED